VQQRAPRCRAEAFAPSDPLLGLFEDLAQPSSFERRVGYRTQAEVGNVRSFATADEETAKADFGSARCVSIAADRSSEVSDPTFLVFAPSTASYLRSASPHASQVKYLGPSD